MLLFLLLSFILNFTVILLINSWATVERALKVTWKFLGSSLISDWVALGKSNASPSFYFEICELLSLNINIKWAYVCVKSSWKPWKCVRTFLLLFPWTAASNIHFSSLKVWAFPTVQETQNVGKDMLWPVPLLPDEFLAIPHLLVNTCLPRSVDLTSPFGKKLSYQLLFSEPWLISPKSLLYVLFTVSSYLLLQIMLT